MDVHTVAQRSHNMRRIRSKDTKPELVIRRAIHALGLRYRLHQRDLPGRPDLVFSSRRAIVFIHGCFWHGHGCSRSALPATRRVFWSGKIFDNQSRDARVLADLRAAGWRVLTVWECALRGLGKQPLPVVARRAQTFILGHEAELEISGNGEFI